MLNNTGDSPHPCLTPLFMEISSDKSSLNLILTFVFLYCTVYNLEKYGTSRQAIDGKIVQHICIVCWITYATDTHSEYIILIAFPWQ